MKRSLFVKIASVLLCVVVFSSGCSAGSQVSNRTDPGQSSTGDQSGEKGNDNAAPAEQTDDSSGKGVSAGNDGTIGEDVSAGGKENTYDLSSLQLSDSRYETIDNLLKSHKEVQQISWSPDRQSVAFSIGDLGWDDQMFLWEAGKSEPVAIEGAKGRICGFSWSPDNRYVLADAGSSIQRGGILVNASYQVKIADISYVGEALWSPDSQWIAVGQVSDIRPVVATELTGTVDLCIYPVRVNEKITLARGTADYYYLPQKWDSDGVLTYVKTNFKDPAKQETLQYNLNLKSGLIHYPSGPDFIKSIVDKRGSVEITKEMRERFNLFARDYRLVYLPDMEYYESFFDANQYAQSFCYNNFGFAVFYVLHYLRCPERVEAETMQNAIQSLFVAKGSYTDMKHQSFDKLAKYEDGYYSPWPEGGPDHNRMFYLLTGLDIEQKGTNGLYITVRSKNYYFNDPNVYVAGENEKWLAEKMKEMGLSDLEAAAELIASGDMVGLPGRRESETILYIELNGQNPESYNPRFVSSNTYGNEPYEN